MTIQTATNTVSNTVSKSGAAADRFAPPRAALAMPKQVLTAPRARFLRSLRNALWALVAPGLRRLG
ncbi:MAG: hypothetical protein CFE33_13665 [Pseudorhodobacter sp. PARRP1]|nr:MAG: hypothetical protein CFE33_13665 [Pseudorhodobacter sp. PARRP1]